MLSKQVHQQCGGLANMFPLNRRLTNTHTPNLSFHTFLVGSTSSWPLQTCPGAQYSAGQLWVSNQHELGTESPNQQPQKSM